MLKYQNLTQIIIGCAMRVHSFLGYGFQEKIYSRCLALEFEDHHLQYEKEKPVKIFYRGKYVGMRRVDFMVEDKILVELKAVGTLDNAHLVQGLNYLDAFDIEVGLLINFGAKSLQFKRLINKKNQDHGSSLQSR